MSERGRGTTTAQMRTAPHGATFIWCNDRLEYVRHLARFLGREDLRIVGPSVLDHSGMRLRGLRGVIVDHAACEFFSQERWQGWKICNDIGIFDVPNAPAPPPERMR